MRALHRRSLVPLASLVCATAIASLVGAGCVPNCKLESSTDCQNAIATGDFGTCPDGNAPVLTCTAARGFCGIEASCPEDAGVTD